jgi:molybdate transport system ATP-binding protein
LEQRRIGMVFQDYVLFPHLSVLENVAFGPRAAGRARDEARQVAMDQLGRLGIAELAARRPAALSGGQAQRVALARALVVAPEALLLDEPLAALDVEVRADVRAELAEHLGAFTGVTVVVTHSLADAAALADQIVVLEAGQVTQRGTAGELASAPASPWIARLTGA